MRKKRILSEEHKKKIGLANSIALKGRKITEEHRNNMSKAKKGKMPKNFLEIQKLGQKLMRGNIPWNKGKKMSKEYCLKVSLAQIGKPRYKNRGEKCHFWRGGITPLRTRIWFSIPYRKWRTDIFKRDNYQCVIGGKEHGNKLEADHYPIPFVYFIRKIQKTNNNNLFEEAMNCKELWKAKGRTLCKDCHNKTKMGRAT